MLEGRQLYDGSHMSNVAGGIWSKQCPNWANTMTSQVPIAANHFDNLNEWSML